MLLVFLNSILLLSLVGTTFSAPAEGPQSALLENYLYNCTDGNCNSLFAQTRNKRSTGKFCDRDGKRSKYDDCVPNLTRCRDICNRVGCWMGSCVAGEANKDDYHCDCNTGYAAITSKSCNDCASGYVKDTGKHRTRYCVENKCAKKDCNQRGDCVMEFNLPNCNCHEGYYGKDCKLPDNCLKKPCNELTEDCVKRGLTDNRCECKEGYIRNKDEVCEVDPCYGKSCDVNQHCAKKDDGTASCECIGGWVKNKETMQCEEDLCYANDCGDNEQCTIRANKVVECECKGGFARNPESLVCVEDTCPADDCKENEECVKRGSGHTSCDCIVGFAKNNGKCAEDKCQEVDCHEGYCDAVDGSCLCKEGYGGTDCSVCAEGYLLDRTTQKCIVSGCLDENICNKRGDCFMEDGIAKCEKCQDRFVGEHCEEPHDPCEDKPCGQNQMCNRIGKTDQHTCTCVEGYKEPDCLTCVRGYLMDRATETCVPSLCARNTCSMRGKCAMRNEATECDCMPGFSGDTCQIAPNPCNFDPCVEGDICRQVGQTLDYTCECADPENLDCNADKAQIFHYSF